MVTGIIIGSAIIVAAIIISCKGIHIKYDKTFTIDDKRMSTNISPEMLKQLEEVLNKKPEATGASFEGNGPMDNVIAEIQELFGPGSEMKKQNPRR